MLPPKWHSHQEQLSPALNPSCAALNLWLQQAVKLPSGHPGLQSLEIKRTMSPASMAPGKEEGAGGTFTCFKAGGGYPAHHQISYF